VKVGEEEEMEPGERGGGSPVALPEVLWAYSP